MMDLYEPYFTFAELRCKCGQCSDEYNVQVMESPEFRGLMDNVMSWRRYELKFPLPVNSGVRCPTYNDSLYGGDGTHLEGPHTIAALDIKVSFERAYRLIKEATAADMGVGPVQHGPVANRFVHIDNIGPRIWTYSR